MHADGERRTETPGSRTVSAAKVHKVLCIGYLVTDGPGSARLPSILAPIGRNERLRARLRRLAVRLASSCFEPFGSIIECPSGGSEVEPGANPERIAPVPRPTPILALPTMGARTDIGMDGIASSSRLVVWVDALVRARFIVRIYLSRVVFAQPPGAQPRRSWNRCFRSLPLSVPSCRAYAWCR